MVRADDPVDTRGMSVVVVSGSRAEHTSFDLPAAIDRIDADRIRDSQLRVNASEALPAVPGLVVQNRLIADGIPATMPDGQGQAATFNLDMAEHIEVLRGPFSALYGNHSGGVIQLFTRDGAGPATIELAVTVGSDGIRKTDLKSVPAAVRPLGRRD